MGAKKRSGGAPTIGVDIGNNLIKVVEARPARNGIQITALGVAPTPPGCVQSDIIVDPQTLGSAVKQLLSESGIKCKRCVSSVSGQSSVVVRIIEVPRMTKKELAETMKWEVERHVPFSANEVIMDFQPIDRPGAAPDDQNMEVLLAVAQQDLVNSHVDTLFAAGLDPVAIDVEPLAISRSLIELARNGDNPETVAIANIGSESTDMAIFQDGVLAFPRTIPIAGEAITRAISDALNVPMEQAEQLKRERGRVIMERVVYSAPEPDLGGPSRFGALGPDTGSTMGLNAQPPAEDAGEQDLSSMGFIPGLGFASEETENEPAGTTPSGEPEFDIDLGEPSDAAPRPPMAFDLSDMDTAPSGGGAPAFDLSADTGPEPAVAPVPPSVPAVQSGDGGGISDEAIFDAMSPVLADLAAEIRRSLEYFTSRYQSQPGSMLICGGTAKLPHIGEYLQAELGIPVSIANPLRNTVLLPRGKSEDYLDEVAAVFPVSVGLAIRDMIGE